MHDPVEIRRRIDRLLVRLSRRDDYGELLAHGHVVRQVEDADAWRAAIRAQAQADRIEVRTGADGCAVHALVRRPDDTPATASTWQPSRSWPPGPPRCGTSRPWSRATVLRCSSAATAARRSATPMPRITSSAAASSIPAAPTRRNRGRRRSASCGRARREMGARPAELPSGMLPKSSSAAATSYPSPRRCRRLTNERDCKKDARASRRCRRRSEQKCQRWARLVREVDGVQGSGRPLPPRRHVAAAVVFYAAAARSASATTCSMSRPSRAARSVRRSSVPPSTGTVTVTAMSGLPDVTCQRAFRYARRDRRRRATRRSRCRAMRRS